MAVALDERKAVWNGNEALRDALTPIDELRPHPRNPRRGVVAAIQQSLQRFGQQRPVLALPDGTLVAGHHVWQAAVAEGWTAIAVTRSDLADAEVEAYLLADNRLADLGLYDDARLAALLEPLRDNDLLYGSGYESPDVDGLLAYLNPTEVLQRAASSGGARAMPYALGEATLFRLVLTYERETYERLIAKLDQLAAQLDVDTYSEVIELVVLDAD